MRGVETLLAFSLVAAGVASGQPLDPKAAAQTYRAALAGLSSGPPRRSLEDLYVLAVRVEKAWRASRVSLESMPEEEFKVLGEQLPGFVLNREEVIVVHPKPSYFLDLAEGHGTPADRSFFTALGETYPENLWPLYIAQQTDYSGCTLFGQGLLVHTYRKWSRFRKDYPRDYVTFATGVLTDIEERVTHNDCPCGDAGSVSRELDEFARAFPKSSAAALAADRAKAVRERRSTIRFNCTSG